MRSDVDYTGRLYCRHAEVGARRATEKEVELDTVYACIPPENTLKTNACFVLFSRRKHRTADDLNLNDHDSPFATSSSRLIHPSRLDPGVIH